jgi:hypothetical protein
MVLRSFGLSKPEARSKTMTTTDFITQLFCRIDDAMAGVPKHSQSKLYPGEVVTLGILYALKGSGDRAFYRYASRDLRPLFPCLPERTRLFRLLAAHQGWTRRFLAEPTVLGVADSFGIELIHPWREGRSDKQIGRKGFSNHRWIVGAKLAFVLNQWGLVVDWETDTASVHDSAFLPLIAQFAGSGAEGEEARMIVLADSHFHSKQDPINLKVCKRGEWNQRMLVETALSMLNAVCKLKRLAHRLWPYLRSRLAFAMAAYNLLVQWDGLKPDEHGFIELHLAQFSL